MPYSPKDLQKHQPQGLIMGLLSPIIPGGGSHLGPEFARALRYEMIQ